MNFGLKKNFQLAHDRITIEDNGFAFQYNVGFEMRVETSPGKWKKAREGYSIHSTAITLEIDHNEVFYEQQTNLVDIMVLKEGVE